MNRDEVIRLALEAGFSKDNTGVYITPFNEVDMTGCLRDFAALVAAHEREACAKVCESQLSSLENADRAWNGAARRCAKEIRARGNV